MVDWSQQVYVPSRSRIFGLYHLGKGEWSQVSKHEVDKSDHSTPLWRMDSLKKPEITWRSFNWGGSNGDTEGQTGLRFDEVTELTSLDNLPEDQGTEQGGGKEESRINQRLGSWRASLGSDSANGEKEWRRKKSR